jgi:hypothetical protein
MPPPLQAAQARPVILALAAAQGFALYGLHRAIADGLWPATDLRWLAPLLLLAALLPLTAQMLAAHLRSRAAASILAGVAAALAGIGWHFGARLATSPAPPYGGAQAFAAGGFALLVLWLIALPFLRLRLSAGRWSTDYPALFRDAWRSKLALAEAGLFTGAFWLLLFLWGRLFDSLGIGFFAELFGMPLFAYPVTAIVFGIALHLVGSIDRLVDVVLGQILGLFKWLAPLAGFIVAAFTLALLPRLPALFTAGERAISAQWLLWLLALSVLLLNAAYQDGRQGTPYARSLARAMRAVPPLMLVVAVAAAYALGLRVAQHGLTVSRYWGLVVAGAALAYASAYTIAALRSGPWLGGMGRSNTMIALALVTVLAASLTPLASPYRLAADSQRARALAATDPETRDAALRHLKLELGGYGEARLRTLAALRDRPDTEAVRDAAQRVLDADEATLYRDAAVNRLQGFDAWYDASMRYPFGFAIPDGAREALRRDFEAGRIGPSDTGSGAAPAALPPTEPALIGWLDLDHDGSAEVMVAEADRGLYSVYALRNGAWRREREGRLGGVTPPDGVESPSK